MAWYRQPVQPWTSVPRRRDGWSSLPAPRAPRPVSQGMGPQIVPNVDERSVGWDPNSQSMQYGPDPYANGPQTPQYPPVRDRVIGPHLGQDVIGPQGGILAALGHQLGQSSDWRTLIGRMAAAYQPQDQLSRIRSQAQDFQHNQGGPAEAAFQRLEHVATAQSAASRLAQLLAARRPSNTRVF